ncbi:hypothetical protein MVEN_01798700 [Mycena venus]|uniref:DUF6534 domain-containing protein n=1 Tax=Mycena venus TaxID=2733690 RepID=A0A8H6XKG0_9AGAR|nr:hypothetical protein MVEN_01798700 [Mycena venus]
MGHAAVSAGKQTQQLTAIAISLRAAGAAADILITGSMIYLLTQPRIQFTSTQRLVFRLLVLSINSGAWTAILAVLDFIFILAFPVYFTFCIFELPICSLYLSTLLVNLNARKFLSNVQTSMDLVDMSGSTRNPTDSAGPIHFVPQGQGHGHLSTRTAYLSHAESGASTGFKKITLTSPEDTDADKPEETIV